MSWSAILIASGIAIAIVFSALTVLVISFYSFSLITSLFKKRKLVKEGAVDKDVKLEDLQLPVDTSAAIAAAIHLYLTDIHDDESLIITIKRIERRYSPWSSKIYGLNNWER